MQPQPTLPVDDNMPFPPPPVVHCQLVPFPAVVEPVDPLVGRISDLIHVAPGNSSLNDFRHVQTVDRLGKRVVIGVTIAAYQGLHTRFGQSLRVTD